MTALHFFSAKTIASAPKNYSFGQLKTAENDLVKEITALKTSMENATEKHQNKILLLEKINATIHQKLSARVIDDEYTSLLDCKTKLMDAMQQNAFDAQQAEATAALHDLQNALTIIKAEIVQQQP